MGRSREHILLSDNNERKWLKTNLFVYMLFICSCKSPKGVTMTGNNKTILFIKQYGETGAKNIMKNTYAAFFTI